MTVLIRELILRCKDSPIGLVVIIGEEDSPHARVMHNMVSDHVAGEIMEVLAPTMKRGDA